MNAQEALEKLKKGNTHHQLDQETGSGRDAARRAQLMSEQKPYAVILSCADSRVVPELVFDTGIGDLFVVRIAGNIATTEAIASIEFGVNVFGPKLVVVLGHESCGAINAAMAGGEHGDNLKHLLDQIKPAVCACSADADVETVVRKNAELNALELVKRSNILSKAVQSPDFKIVSGYYCLETGAVDFT